MNFRRGLFRVWIIFSVLFAVPTLIFAVVIFQKQRADVERQIVEDDPYRAFITPEYTDAELRAKPWELMAMLAGVAFGVPLVVLGGGITILWVASGFRRQ